MSVIKSIEEARKRGATDEMIINELVKQNPSKAQSFNQALQRGANPADILNEVVNQNQPTTSGQKKSLLRKVGDFFTSSTQKFGKTLGATASVIDPVTSRRREEALDTVNTSLNTILKRAASEKDEGKKAKMLFLANNLAQAEGIDIYDNPDYQKSAKQIIGEAAGTLTEILPFGSFKGLGIGSTVLGAGKRTVAQTALRGATQGALLGGSSMAARAAQEDKTGRQIATSGVGGALLGGGIGLAGGALAGKIATGKEQRLLKSTFGKMTPTARKAAYRAGKMKEATLLRGEKVITGKKEMDLVRVAKDAGLKGKSPSKDIAKATSEITREANKLKDILKTKGIYNKNTIKGQLNKMKADKTTDLIDAEVKVYDKMISKFNKMADAQKNKKLDGLLDLRQSFDAWAKSNNPNIFDNKTGGSYRALKAVRDTVNDYINKQAKNDIVKNSLDKQTKLYDIAGNLAELASSKSKLAPAKLSGPLKKAAKWGAVLGGGYLLGKGGAKGGVRFLD